MVINTKIKCEKCKHTYPFMDIQKVCGHNYCSKCSLTMGKGHTRKLNTIITEGDISYILSSANKEIILVDTADLPMLSQYTWNISKWGYAICKYENRSIFMHSLLTGFQYSLEKDIQIDHINNIKSDNRRSNLRTITRSCNSANRYYKNKTGERYIDIYRGGYRVIVKKQWGGNFTTLEKAIIKRDELVIGLSVEEPYCRFSRGQSHAINI